MPLEFRSVLEAKKLSCGNRLHLAIRVKIVACNLIYNEQFITISYN